MRSIFLFSLVSLIASMMWLKAPGIEIGMSSAWAVKPPPDEIRHKAEEGRRKDVKGKVGAQRAGGCKYGKDKKTGKCYEPREGQFYRDPQTGEVKVKEIGCVNLPWKPCK